MKACLEGLEAGTVVLLHACCHNPTGYDLNAEQWAEVTRIIQERDLLPFLDIAYQGFGSGLDDDAAAVRALCAAGVSFMVSSSCSKNFGLYGERAGGLHVVTPTQTKPQWSPPSSRPSSAPNTPTLPRTAPLSSTKSSTTKSSTPSGG